MSNESSVWKLNAMLSLKNVPVSKINKLKLGHLNINSIRNKFDLSNKGIKGFIDVLMVTETKLDDSFPEGQSLVESIHSPFRFDCNKNDGIIKLYVREDIPSTLLSHEFPFTESFFCRN